MAKRSRRPRKGKAPRPQRYSRGRPSGQPPAPSRAATAVPSRPERVEAAAPTTSTAASTVDFAKEYHYVIQDLRRLFVLAAALMALLIVLAYFLT